MAGGAGGEVMRTVQGNINLKVDTGYFKDIEFRCVDRGHAEIIFTPMGCHLDSCQICWTLSRQDYLKIGAALFGILREVE